MLHSIAGNFLNLTRLSRGDRITCFPIGRVYIIVRCLQLHSWLCYLPPKFSLAVMWFFFRRSLEVVFGQG